MTDSEKALYQFIGEMLKHLAPGLIIIAIIFVAIAVALAVRWFILNHRKNSNLHK